MEEKLNLDTCTLELTCSRVECLQIISCNPSMISDSSSYTLFTSTPAASHKRSPSYTSNPGLGRLEGRSEGTIGGKHGISKDLPSDGTGRRPRALKSRRLYSNDSKCGVGKRQYLGILNSSAISCMQQNPNWFCYYCTM